MILEGRTAVITGAAGGIGRALAQALAARGCHLALADVDKRGLAETGRSLSSVRVSLHPLDVADAAAVAALPDAVVAAHGGAALLVNNAGVALAGTFEEVDQADMEWLFGVNFWGTVRMTRAFLPLLRAARAARIVNLSSLFGLIAPPGQTAYAASKYAVRGFSDALRHELAGSGVGVTTVHPGGVDTAIARSARHGARLDAIQAARDLAAFERHLRLPPAAAAEAILRGVERGRSRVIVGRDAKLAALVERLTPVSYWRWIGRAF